MRNRKSLRVFKVFSALMVAVLLLGPSLAAPPRQGRSLPLLPGQASAQSFLNQYLPFVQDPTVSLIEDFERTPPRVTGAQIELLDEPVENGDTRLMVRFEEGEKLPLTFPFELEQGLVLLRDDGRGVDREGMDGVYSAAFKLDQADLEATNRHLEEWMQKVDVIPVFEQRERVGFEPIRRLELQRLQEGGLIDIFIPLGIPPAVDPERTLVVRHLDVVEDPARTFNPCNMAGTPMGAWTFGKLMEDMANTPVTGLSGSTLVRRWLHEWEVAQTVNGELVPERLDIQNLIINPWQNASGAGNPLNLAIAPFRLLAIVNRIDLRGNVVYGGGAGEGRFVFGALDVKNNCAPLPFTVIFEYGIPKTGCIAARDWAKQWLNLQTMAIGSPAYNAALQAITDQFATAGADPSKPPNLSALNQLRTNEIALDSPWELREFTLQPTALLDQVTVKQTPAFPFNGTDTLASYINANEADILLGEHSVPEDFPLVGMDFLGGAGPTPGGMFWDGPPAPGLPINNPQARHMFSLHTCSGCHARETDTGFTHIVPVPFGAVAPMSGFMTGIDVLDPSDLVTIRHFDDLDDRAQKLDALANSSCFFRLFDVPLLMVH